MSIIASSKKEQFLLTLDYCQDVEYIEGDLENISKMLPTLFDSQKEDVLRAEQRFKEGKGRLFTNGTGTGKTFVGLGIAKRFHARGLSNILIVAPTEQKCSDWIQEAVKVELSIYMLSGINDAGYGIVTTTYANFYQNDALYDREWDLIIYDESHYLNQNAKGKATAYLHKHKMLSNVPSGAREKALKIVGPEPQYNSSDKMYPFKLLAWVNQMEHYTYHLVESTKVVFLSATPFAYIESIRYADGCLFDIEESLDPIQEEKRFEDDAIGFEKFLVENFGYRMQNGRCIIPDVGVDLDQKEREFFEKYAALNVMSTRVLELDKDYSREFVQVRSDLGNFINSGLEMWYDEYVRKKYPNLTKVIKAKYSYGFTNQLLEAIKVKEILDRIKKHLNMGRKVIVFHNYNHTVAEHPFKFDPYKMVKKEEQFMIPALQREIIKWEKEYPQYVNLDLDDLSNVRKTLREEFPDILEINGTVSSKKKRRENKNKFNDNYSGYDLIMIQSDAGREGISLHDKIGDKQRVLINLSLPTRPTGAIQTEGRTYRSGLMSNAIYEYVTLHTNFERIAFAEKIAERSRTAENLAMGNLARDLETAFKEGYINFILEDPHPGQGTGGKRKDRQLLGISDYERSKVMYFSRRKRNLPNVSTPEPLAYKMLQWLDPQPNESGLEPSAGRGSIGRFFPGYTNNTFIEPELELFSEMTLYCKGRIVNSTFDEFNIINKYDFIAMFPPGRVAADHVQKAVMNHMTQRNPKGSRLLAIVPDRDFVENSLNEFYNSRPFVNYKLTGEILLPECAFSFGAKIIKIEHVNSWTEGKVEINLTDCSDIGEFFARLENLKF